MKNSSPTTKKTRPGRWIAAALTCSAIVTCGYGPHLSVEICSDMIIPDEIDAVRLLFSQSGETDKIGGYLDLLDPDRMPDDPCPTIVNQFPISFSQVDGRGEMLLGAEGLLDGVVKVRSDAKATFPERGTEAVRLVLSSACIGVNCYRGQTCINGRCELIPLGDSAHCPDPAPDIPIEIRCPPKEEEEWQEDTQDNEDI